jgi:hypothetical protein
MAKPKEEKRPPDTSEILRNLSLMNQAVAAIEEYGYQQPDPEWYRLDGIFCQSRAWLNEHGIHPRYNGKRWRLR